MGELVRFFRDQNSQRRYHSFSRSADGSIVTLCGQRATGRQEELVSASYRSRIEATGQMCRLCVHQEKLIAGDFDSLAANSEHTRSDPLAS